jgi:4-hydroxy-4-methyl-2-oxoglutarate aldolase
MNQNLNPTSSLIEFLTTVDSPTHSNAIETLDLQPRAAGFTPLQIRCLFPEFGRLCGYAVTAQVETVTGMHPTAERTFLELFQAVKDSPKPAVVAFQEIGGHADYAAHCGEVMATAFTRLGAVGLVTDAAVRDVPEVRALRFHYFARGTVVSHANFRIVRVGVPIQIKGLELQPGDLLHGDENGLLRIPPAALASLPQAVDRVRARERRLMDFMRSPEFSIEQLKGRFIE